MKEKIQQYMVVAAEVGEKQGKTFVNQNDLPVLKRSFSD